MWLAATILRGKRNPWPLLPVRDRHIESLFFYWHTLRAMPTALVGWGKMKRGREATKGSEGGGTRKIRTLLPLLDGDAPTKGIMVVRNCLLAWLQKSSITST